MDYPSHNISAIKNRVINQLRASDDKLYVESTDYFNHSYAPDLVLRWNADGEGQGRKVYLRTNTEPDYLLEDVRIICRTHPILMPLKALVKITDRNSALEEQSATTGTLVADPSAFQAFTEGSKGSPVIGLLSRAVLQGGRGLVGAERAIGAGEKVSVGFDAAQRAAAEPIREAIEITDSILDAAHAEKWTQLFQALWLGSGATATSFPGTADLTVTLDPEALQLLLDVAATNDSSFWRRIGAGLTLECLSEVTASGESENLQLLVLSNIDRLRARACQLTANHESPDRNLTQRWFVREGLLGLQASSFLAFFSSVSLSDSRFLSAPPGKRVDVVELLERARLSGAKIGELELEAAGGEIVNYKNRSKSDVADDSFLQDLGALLGRQMSVRAATTLLDAGARHLRCDFTTGTASGRTVAKYSLSEFMSNAVPLLRPLLPGERELLLQIARAADAFSSPAQTSY
jgi:hypothetical protein